MVSPLFFYQLTFFVLVWLFVMLHVMWSKPGLPTPPVPAPPRRPAQGSGQIRAHAQHDMRHEESCDPLVEREP